MKICRIAAVLALCLLMTTTAALAKPIITSDSNYFDINTGRYILEGNVYIKTGSRVITAGNAQVSITSLEVWGQNGVKVVQDDITFTGQNVYVSGKQRTAYIDGGVDLEREGLSIKADTVEYSWQTKIAKFNGNISVNAQGQSYTAEYLEYDMDANQIL